MKYLALLGDQGGTNGRFVLAEFAMDGPLWFDVKAVVVVKGVGERPYSEILREALTRLGVNVSDIQIVVIAAAGDYHAKEDRVYLAKYLNGFLDIGTAKKELGITCSVVILNDLEAEAACGETDGGKDFILLRSGLEVSQGWYPFIAPGTGVGVAAMHWSGRILRTELGNTSLLTPADESLWGIWGDLRRELLKRGGRSAIRAEGLFGGPGLPILHGVLTGKDLTAEEIGVMIRDNSPDVQETVRVWATAWGEYCASTVLAFWPPAVLTLSGVLRTDRQLVQNPHFLAGFGDYRSNEQSLSRVEIRLLQGDFTVLWGCLWWARNIQRQFNEVKA